MNPICLLLLIPILCAALHAKTGWYPFSAAVTLTCLVSVFPWADPRILAAYALSVIGDWFMAHSGGKNGDRMLLGGIAGFFLAHACFLLFSVDRADFSSGRLLWLIPSGAAAVGYALFLVRALYPAVPDRMLKIAATAYTGISLAVLAFSLLSSSAPIPKALFCFGIAMILFSDTLIALSRFLKKKGLGRWICPTYFACHILIAASMMAEAGFFG
jgi:hypothetical protein